MTAYSGMFGSSVLLSKTLINEHFDKKTVVPQKPFNWFNLRYIFVSIVRDCRKILRKFITN